MYSHSTGQPVNYLAILIIAIASSAALLAANQGVFGGSTTTASDMAPTMERLAWLATQPTPSAPVVPMITVGDGRLPLPRTLMTEGQPYTINVVGGVGMVLVGEVWYPCTTQDRPGLTREQGFTVQGLCSVQGAW